MKIALVCIAKNEDNYIEEWIKYHKKLGFDNIYIYMNNWRTNVKDCILIPFDGQKQQIPAYNAFIKKYNKKYDFAAFIDVDEFIVLKKWNNIKTCLNDYKNIPILGIPWRCFGSNGHKEIINNNYSVINRFTKSCKSLSTYKKLIINFKLASNAKFYDPHYLTNYKAIDPLKKYETKTSLFPKEIEKENEPIELNHYILKTLKERLERKKSDAYYGDKYALDNFQDEKNIKWFNDSDVQMSEINNFNAYNFYNDISI